MTVDPLAFQQCFMGWLIELKNATDSDDDSPAEKAVHPGLSWVQI